MCHFLSCPGSRMRVRHARTLMCLMILSLCASLLFVVLICKYMKDLPENEKRAFICKQVEELKLNKDVEEINNTMYDLELDISEMNKPVFCSV